MAAIVNDRDLILQATTPRIATVTLGDNIVVPAIKAVELTAPTIIFPVDREGVTTVPSILITANLRQIIGPATFEVIPPMGVLPDDVAILTGDTEPYSRELLFTNFFANSVTIRVTVTELMVDYVDEITLVKVQDGLNGDSIRFAYQRSLTQPTPPVTPDPMFPDDPPGTLYPPWYPEVGLVPAGDGFIWVSIGTRTNLDADFTWDTATQLEGSDVRALTLTATGGNFIFKDAATTTSPSPTITLTATLQNDTGTVGFAATAFNAAGTSLGSVTLSGSGNTRTLSSTQFNALGATTVRYVRITATLDDPTEGGLSDIVTVYRVDGGDDALSITLSNENHPLPSNPDGSVISYAGASTQVKVFRGATEITNQCTFTIANSAGLVTSPAAGSSTVNPSSFTVSVTSLTPEATLSGTSTITATYQGVAISKVFSVVKQIEGEAGADGADGANAKNIAVVASSYVFREDKTSAVTPASITFTALTQNTTGTISWTTSPNIKSGTGTSFSISVAEFAANNLVEVTATVGAPDNISDKVSIIRVREGDDSISVYQTNPAHNVTANALGRVDSLTGSGTTIVVFQGDAALTYSSTLATNGTFRITSTSVSPVGAVTLAAITSGVIANHTAFSDAVSMATITYNIEIKPRGWVSGDAFITTSTVQTLTKLNRVAKVELTAPTTTFVYNALGTTPSPTGPITVTATPSQTTGSTVYYRFSLNNGSTWTPASPSASTTATFSYTPQALFSNMPQTILCEMHSAATVTGSTLLASNTLAMNATRIGDNGAKAVSVAINAASYVFREDKSGVVSPSSIAFTATTQNTTGTISWTTSPNIASGTGTSFSITNTQFAANTSVQVTATVGAPDNITDRCTIVRVIEGTDSLSVFQTNPAHNVTANALGLVDSLVGSGTTVLVYQGDTALTYSSTLATNGTFRITSTSVSPGGAVTLAAITSGVIADHTAFSSTVSLATITYNIEIKPVGWVTGDPFVTTSTVQTLTKLNRAASLDLTAPTTSFTYNSLGTTPSPAGPITVTATPTNTTGSTVYYRFSLNNGSTWTPASPAASTTATFAYTPQASFTNMPQTVLCEMHNAATVGAGTLLASATLAMNATRIGTTGDNARIMYAVLTSGTTFTLGSSAIIAGDNRPGTGDNSFGVTPITWTANPATYTAGQSLFQSNGTYNVTTNQTTWTTPYLSNLKVGSLSAIVANIGQLTVDNTGFIRGQQTAYRTGYGFFLGYSTNAYKMSIGEPGRVATANVTTNAFTLTDHGYVNTGALYFSNLGTVTGISVGVKYFIVNATASTFQVALTSGGAAIDLTGTNSSVTIGASEFYYDGTDFVLQGGTLDLGTIGSIRGGQTAYNTGDGFFLGYNNNVHKLSLGRQAKTATLASSVFTLANHNFVLNDIVVFTAKDASMTNLSLNQIYYATTITTNTFQLAIVPSGSVATLAGSGNATISSSMLLFDNKGLTANGCAINGATFQTALSGQRAVVDAYAGRFECYSSINTRVITMNASTGLVIGTENTAPTDNAVHISTGSTFDGKSLRITNTRTSVTNNAASLFMSNSGAFSIYSTNNYAGVFGSAFFNNTVAGSATMYVENTGSNGKAAEFNGSVNVTGVLTTANITNSTTITANGSTTAASVVINNTGTSGTAGRLITGTISSSTNGADAILINNGGTGRGILVNNTLSTNSAVGVACVHSGVGPSGYFENTNTGVGNAGAAINGFAAGSSAAMTIVNRLPTGSGASGLTARFTHQTNLVTDASGTAGAIVAGVARAFYAEVGTIGPFTGSHDGLILKSITPELGDIMVDDLIVKTKGLNDTISTLVISSLANQKGAIGVFTGSDILRVENPPAVFLENDEEGNLIPSEDYFDYFDSHNLVGVNSLGEGMINVCGLGGTIEKGDLIVCSTLAGKGMKQSDDIVRSYTVAKARETVTFSSEYEVKQIACIYMCG